MITAVSLGVVYSRVTGKIVRVINPTYEEELDLHHVDRNEFMLRVDKVAHRVSGDVMTLDDLHRIIEAMT